MPLRLLTFPPTNILYILLFSRPDFRRCIMVVRCHVTTDFKATMTQWLDVPVLKSGEILAQEQVL